MFGKCWLTCISWELFHVISSSSVQFVSIWFPAWIFSGCDLLWLTFLNLTIRLAILFRTKFANFYIWLLSFCNLWFQLIWNFTLNFLFLFYNYFFYEWSEAKHSNLLRTIFAKYELEYFIQNEYSIFVYFDYKYYQNKEVNQQYNKY